MTVSERVEVFAPGRVNIIGDHTDHTGGWCLPIAINLGVTITGARTQDACVRLSSEIQAVVAEVSLDVADAPAVEPAWARYVAGVVIQLRPSTGFDGVVGSTLPTGVGLSSSAALEVAVALALGAADSDPVALARLCQAAEHAARGVPTGILDQISSICGVAGHALLLDCDAVTVTPVQLPPSGEVEWIVVVPSSGRDLATSGYADRVADLALAEREIGPLRLARPGDLASIADPTVRARARHVVSENARVHDFVSAVAAGDVREAGRLMIASHASLSRDFESSTRSIDELCGELAGTDGVLGARITGGGWGGSVIAMARPGVLAGWPGALAVSPGDGARRRLLRREAGD